jgi:hypothetical protein
MTVLELYLEAEKLSPADRRELIKRLVDTLVYSVGDEPEKKYNILDFLGIAEHLRDIDPQEYVNQLRDEWDK